jgi:hypothetical protein
MARQKRTDPGPGSGPQRYPGTFLLAFREAAARLQWTVQRALGDAVACVDAEGREQVIPLENLYRRARRAPRASWPGLIAGFLRILRAGQVAELPGELAEVADCLLVRVGRPPEGAAAWSQPLPGTGLVVNLVIDYAQSLFYVPAALVAKSGRPAAEWVERAAANLRAQTPADCFEVGHDESGLLGCSVRDGYDAARSLLLDDLLPEGRDDGYFVALPGHDELLVLPVTQRTLEHLPLLKALAEQQCRTAPHPITDDVFWIRAGVWHLFPLQFDGDSLSGEPPPEFQEVLQRLAPQGGAEGAAP